MRLRPGEYVCHGVTGGGESHYNTLTLLSHSRHDARGYHHTQPLCHHAWPHMMLCDLLTSLLSHMCLYPRHKARCAVWLLVSAAQSRSGDCQGSECQVLSTHQPQPRPASAGRGLCSPRPHIPGLASRLASPSHS